jgi:hypothetical protein
MPGLLPGARPNGRHEDSSHLDHLIKGESAGVQGQRALHALETKKGDIQNQYDTRGIVSPLDSARSLPQGRPLLEINRLEITNG